MDLDESDLVRVRSASGDSLVTGIVIDVDPSEGGPTYYYIYVPGHVPEWYHEDEVYSVQEA